MRRWPKRRPEGFNLAFLDIMACGLGAILLIFMLVKYHSEEPDTELNALQAELAGRQDEAAAIEAENRALAARIEQLQQTLQQRIKRSAQSDEESTATAEALIALAKQIAELEKEKTERDNIPQPQQDTEQPPETTKEKPREEHLIGLRVSGKRILILLDNSASMAAERLVDIVKIKAAGTAAKQAAAKWQRAVSAVRWIIERVPENSAYMVIHYNAKADFLLDQKWLDGDDASARSSVYRALKELYPREATDLHAALELIKTSSISPTDIYLITDSLPTKGNLPTLERVKRCGIISNKTTVSGECRLALFDAAVRSFSRSDATVSTVLLPVEGDPDAAYAYWNWAAATNGIMLSPAGVWP